MIINWKIFWFLEFHKKKRLAAKYQSSWAQNTPIESWDWGSLTSEILVSNEETQKFCGHVKRSEWAEMPDWKLDFTDRWGRACYTDRWNGAPFLTSLVPIDKQWKQQNGLREQ